MAAITPTEGQADQKILDWNPSVALSWERGQRLIA